MVDKHRKIMKAVEALLRGLEVRVGAHSWILDEDLCLCSITIRESDGRKVFMRELSDSFSHTLQMFANMTDEDYFNIKTSLTIHKSFKERNKVHE